MIPQSFSKWTFVLLLLICKKFALFAQTDPICIPTRIDSSSSNNNIKSIYRIGVLAIRGSDAAYEEFNKTFSDYLTATAGQRFIPPIQFEMKPQNFIQLFEDVEKSLSSSDNNDGVDFIYVNPSAYSCIESEYGASTLVSQISRRVVGGEVYSLTKFGGVIFTLANRTDIESIEDLRDQKIAAASISGLGSGQMQFRLLQQRGLSYIQDPKQLIFTSNQGKVVNGVLNGDFDVGFVRTDQIERTKDSKTGEFVNPLEFKILEGSYPTMLDGETFPFESSTILYPEWNLGSLPNVPSNVASEVQTAMMNLAKYADISEFLEECIESCILPVPIACETTCMQLAEPTLCDTTRELAALAAEAKSNGKYTAWRSTLSYMELRNMQEETNFIRLEQDGINRCIRTSRIYDAVVCPPGHFRKSEEDVSNGCNGDEFFDCTQADYTCLCKPCVKAFDVDVYQATTTTTTENSDEDDMVAEPITPTFDGGGGVVVGCNKFAICGHVEQSKSIKFFAVDNKERDDVILHVIVLEEGDLSRELKVDKTPHTNYTYEFIYDATGISVGTVILEVFIDSEQIPESPFRLSVLERDCASEYGDSLLMADDDGNCVCESGSHEFGRHRCISNAILIPSIVIPLLFLLALCVYWYVERKRKQADSVWEVNADELHFDDPPAILGRGTFGLVLLARYRGTQVAVKRVIPPRIHKRQRSHRHVHHASTGSSSSNGSSWRNSNFGIGDVGDYTDPDPNKAVQFEFDEAELKNMKENATAANNHSSAILDASVVKRASGDNSVVSSTSTTTTNRPNGGSRRHSLGGMFPSASNLVKEPSFAQRRNSYFDFENLVEENDGNKKSSSSMNSNHNSSSSNNKRRSSDGSAGSNDGGGTTTTTTTTTGSLSRLGLESGGLKTLREQLNGTTGGEANQGGKRGGRQVSRRHSIGTPVVSNNHNNTRSSGGEGRFRRISLTSLSRPPTREVLGDLIPSSEDAAAAAAAAAASEPSSTGSGTKAQRRLSNVSHDSIDSMASDDLESAIRASMVKFPGASMIPRSSALVDYDGDDDDDDDDDDGPGDDTPDEPMPLPTLPPIMKRRHSLDNNQSSWTGRPPRATRRGSGGHGSSFTDHHHPLTSTSPSNSSRNNNSFDDTGREEAPVTKSTQRESESSWISNDDDMILQQGVESIGMQSFALGSRSLALQSGVGVQVGESGGTNFSGSNPKSSGSRSIGLLNLKQIIFGNRDEYARLKADFISEMRHLSKLRHPCITTVMGAVIDRKSEPMLVMEYMDHGSLYDLLHNESMIVDGELVLPILKDITQGVRFLHAANPQVIHGDLKSANVLVDSKFRAKVADFGLSQKKRVGATGTPLWMAPELLRGESENTAASDVYSFGIILYEVYSRKDPYDGEDHLEALKLICDPNVNKRPPIPKGCPEKVAALMSDSLVAAPDSRPTFEELDLRLKRLDVENVEPKFQNFSMQRKKKEQRAARNEELLFEVFPRHVAEALRDGRKVEAESFDCVTVFFSDIVGYTTISSKLHPRKVSDMLDRLYLKFDELSTEHEVFKIETIGDAYICVTNLAKDQPDHAARIARFSIDAMQAANSTLIDQEDPSKGYVKIRVGFHSGAIVADVVGSRSPKYTLFGDTVNTASRMESHSLPLRIQCSDRSAELIKAQDPTVKLVSRGKIAIKGKGEMQTFWVNEDDDADDEDDAARALSQSRKGQQTLHAISEG